MKKDAPRPTLFTIDVTDVGLFGRAFEARLPDGQVIGLTIPDHEQDKFMRAFKQAVAVEVPTTNGMVLDEDD